MKSILFAWLGNTDIRLISQQNPDDTGPIGYAIKEFGFSHFVLLSTFDKNVIKSYRLEFERHFKCNIETFPISLPSPIDFSAIYEADVKVIQEIKNKFRNDVFNITYHLSPGTPAMAAVWMLIANSVHPGELIEVSKEEGAKKVLVPFDISADYIPFGQSSFKKDYLELLEAKPPDIPEFSIIIHRCDEMKQALRQAYRLARFDVPVLLLGESGTGKELFAKAIHQSSERREKNMVTINCGAIPGELVESELFGYVKGAFTNALRDKTGQIEAADSGTLFLDEMGDLPLLVQVKLLRALQDGVITPVGSVKEKRVDFRLIAATNQDLFQLIRQNSFRKDLFHRIAVGVIKLPALRNRQGDLSLLTDSIEKQINQKFSKYDGWKYKKFSAGAKKIILSYYWPGNIRELQNTLTRMMLWEEGETVTEENARRSIMFLQDEREDILNRPIGTGFDLKEVIGEVERHYLDRALRDSGGVIQNAAALLGFETYQTFNNWCKRNNLK